MLSGEGMKLQLVRGWHMLVAICLALVVSSCAPVPQQNIRIATNVWPGYEPIYLARDLGYLDDMGIQMVEMTSTTSVLQALRGGVVEAAMLTLDEFLLLNQFSPDYQAVLVTDVSRGGDALVVHPDAGIESLADLKGRRVGAETTALGAYMMQRALQKGGLQASDVKVMNIDESAVEQAYSSRKVDAVVTFNPVLQRLRKRGGKVLFDSSMIPGEIIDVLAVRRDVLENNTARLQHLIAQWFAALKYMQDKPQDAYARMSLRLQCRPEDVPHEYAGLELPGAQENRRLLQQQLIISAQNMSGVMLQQHLLRARPRLDELFTAQVLP